MTEVTLPMTWVGKYSADELAKRKQFTSLMEVWGKAAQITKKLNQDDPDRHNREMTAFGITTKAMKGEECLWKDYKIVMTSNLKEAQLYGEIYLDTMRMSRDGYDRIEQEITPAQPRVKTVVYED